MKLCKKCKGLFPSNTYNFYKKKWSNDGLDDWCKDCKREKNNKNKRV